MNDKVPDDLKNYFRAADEWSADRERSWRMALRTAWIAAGVLGVVALAEAGAIIMMMPLKTVVPYTLMVDRQTGYVQAIKPLDRETVAPDKRAGAFFIAQYVIARGLRYRQPEGGLSQGHAVVDGRGAQPLCRGYSGVQSGQSADCLAAPCDHHHRDQGISSLGPDTVLVRFVTMRTDPGGQAQAPQPWQAVVTYRFAAGAMSAADRLANPLGFQVLRYRRDAEIAPSAEAQAAAAQPTLARAPTIGSASAPAAVAPASAAPVTPAAAMRKAP
jgi:type IV secretion system protein VirB8